MSGNFLTVPELAERHRTTEAAIHLRRHRGACPPAYKIGGRLLFDLDEVRAWERDQRSDPQPAA